MLSSRSEDGLDFGCNPQINLCKILSAEGQGTGRTGGIVISPGSVRRQKFVHSITLIPFEIIGRHLYQVKTVCRVQDWLPSLAGLLRYLP